MSAPAQQAQLLYHECQLVGQKYRRGKCSKSHKIGHFARSIRGKDQHVEVKDGTKDGIGDIQHASFGHEAKIGQHAALRQLEYLTGVSNKGNDQVRRIK